MITMTIEELYSWRDFYRSTDHFDKAVEIEAKLIERCIARDAILDLAEQLDAEGLAVVPKMPTEEMREAGVDNNPTYFNEGTDRGFAWEVVDMVYWAMLAAAPLPASPSSVEG